MWEKDLEKEEDLISNILGIDKKHEHVGRVLDAIIWYNRFIHGLREDYPRIRHLLDEI